MTDKTTTNDDDAPLELTAQDAKPKARKRRPGGIMIRLDSETSARVDNYLEKFRRRNPGIVPERAEILINLIHHGLRSTENSLAQLTDDELRAMADEHGILYDQLDHGPGGLRRYLIDALEATL